MSLPPGHIPPDDDLDEDEEHPLGGERPKNVRDIFFLSRRPDVEVPEGHSRICPQCGHETWADTRWCKHCVYDFDRALVRRWHPIKLLWLAAAALLVQSFVILYLVLVR